MYLIAFPLLLVSFALYNMILFMLNMPLTDTAASIPLPDDRRMPLAIGDLLVLFSFLPLYLEVLKSARISREVGHGSLARFHFAHGDGGRACARAAGDDNHLVAACRVKLHRRDNRDLAFICSQVAEDRGRKS